MSDCDRTALFSNGNGFVALNSPVKIQILDFLKISSRSFDEIVKHTGKAKSTVSVHLNDLRSSGLVEEEYDPDDKRRKTYHLKCEHMAHSQTPILKHYRNVLETLASPRLEKHGCFKCFFRAIQFGFDAHGINSDPIMRKVGRDIGISISSTFASKDIEFLIQELAEFWKRYQMGTMYVESREPLVIAVENSFDYRLISTIGKNLCSFTEGIIEGTMVHSLNITCCVQEVECCGNGKERCLFIVHFLNK
ncbi:ArsR family transcriptional regulator [uncultured Methanomethylovorans sp.]|uniref:ArsR family transcriptional regulator n=1 Tax=uncultured Methanomethylovorans sp. TaxID=183759 RepID=UPI002AA8612F|nr:ArsR family transcriptional regulator [uncultured Methanomethylovorans sp.]